MWKSSATSLKFQSVTESWIVVPGDSSYVSVGRELGWFGSVPVGARPHDSSTCPLPGGAGALGSSTARAAGALRAASEAKTSVAASSLPRRRRRPRRPPGLVSFSERSTALLVLTSCLSFCREEAG